MEVRTESQTGPKVASLPEILGDIHQELDDQQKLWLQKLLDDPSRLGEIELEVHRAFKGLADQVVAGLLAKIGQAPQLQEDVKKK